MAMPSQIPTGEQSDLPELPEKDQFGRCLRNARESRHLSLNELSAATKVPCSLLEQLEASDLDQLPAEVFVRGFIRSYARAVGLPEAEPMFLYERTLQLRRDAERARSRVPVVIAGPMGEDESAKPALGLAVFVIVLLLIATITLSLLLRRPPHSGEGLSEAPSDVTPVAAVLHASA